MTTKPEKSNTPNDEPPLPFAEPIEASTEPQKGTAGRKPKEDKDSFVVLQIRGVDRESKAVFEKAAKRSGKAAGQFFNTEIREFLQGIVKKSAQPPATEQDLKAMINNRLDEMQEVIKQNQQQQITPEDIAEKVAQIIAAKPDGEKKPMLARIIEAIRG